MDDEECNVQEGVDFVVRVAEQSRLFKFLKQGKYLEHSQRTLQNAFFVKIEATITKKNVKSDSQPTVYFNSTFYTLLQ